MLEIERNGGSKGAAKTERCELFAVDIQTELSA